MQTSVPELTDLSDETQDTLELYGPDVDDAGHLRRQLPARPPAGRARRAVHADLHRGWDQHGNLPGDMPNQCRDVDQPAAP